MDFVSPEAVDSALQQHGHLRALDLAHGNVLLVSINQGGYERSCMWHCVHVCVRLWLE